MTYFFLIKTNGQFKIHVNNTTTSTATPRGLGMQQPNCSHRKMPRPKNTLICEGLVALSRLPAQGTTEFTLTNLISK